MSYCHILDSEWSGSRVTHRAAVWVVVASWIPGRQHWLHELERKYLSPRWNAVSSLYWLLSKSVGLPLTFPRKWCWNQVCNCLLTFAVTEHVIFEENWPIGGNFPLFQSKKPNWEGISKALYMAMNNNPCDAAALRWGRGHESPSQPCTHPSKGTDLSSSWVTSCLKATVRGNPGLKWSPCLALCSTILIIWCNYVIN